MTISVTPRFGLTVWDSKDDQITREQFTANFSAIEALGAQCTVDVRANRPVPGQGQRFFYADDEQILYYDTGIAWQVCLFTPDSEVISGARPAPGSKGRYLFESDALRLFRDTGSRYVELLTSAVVPAGIIMPTLAAAQPPGWLFCDGSAHATGSYPDLYAAIGYKFGSSGTSFKVPDLRGVFLAGAPSLGAGGFGQVGAHGHGTHHHVREYINHVHQFFVQTLGAEVGLTSPPFDAYHDTNSLVGTSSNTSDDPVPQSAPMLTYLYASYLIKATGGPHD